MAVIPAIGNLVTPANISPASPATYEQMVDLFEQIASANNGSGITAAGTNISNATTNQALVTVPWSNVQGFTTGNVIELKSYGIYSTPASSAATLAWNGYSNGSGGTALASMVAISAPTASQTNALWDAYMRVQWYTPT